MSRARLTVDPIGEADSDANEPDLPGDNAATPFLSRELGLIHRYSRGIDSGTKTSDHTTDDQMRECESGSLQRCTNNDQPHGHPNHPSSTEDVADEEVGYASEESAKAVATDCNASDCGRRMMKLIEPSFILEQAAENALIISKEEEGGETGCVDGCP